jgi:hypothetical protein
MVNDKEIEVKRDISEVTFLYLHDNFVVTDGVFVDQNIIFDDVTEGWKDYCVNILGFNTDPIQAAKTGQSEPAASTA